MNKQAPSAGRIMTMLVFALSCVGLLIFLWVSFGGSVPLAPQGYRFNVEFDQAVQLAEQADVRISGVSVGKVVSKSLDRKTGLTRAVIQIDSQFAPRPIDTRAILRQKTLLGETYVQLSPGTQGAPSLPDGGTLPEAQVEPTVQLDQILSTFDPVTRHAFQVWMQQGGMALTNRGQDFNAAFAYLYPFATNVDAVLAVLNRDSAATTTLLRDGGQVFSALSQSPSQLQGFIRNSNSVFQTTAAQDQALANAVRAFPAFNVATTLTIDRVKQFAQTTQPLINELRPAAVPLSQALEASVPVAPQLLNLMTNIGPLTSASAAGVPALEQFLNQSVPWLRRLTPYLGNLIPVIDYINDYRREVAAFFANSTANTQGVLLNNASTLGLHYLRISNPVNPETLTSYQSILESARRNPYMVPGGFDALVKGLSVFGSYLCTNNPQPTIGSTIPANLAKVLRDVYYTSHPGGPPCKAQPPLGSVTTGQLQSFPHLKPLP
jgi:phospholipid/cholesterol/gamma-HCH transport system substrate-binding protein